MGLFLCNGSRSTAESGHSIISSVFVGDVKYFSISHARYKSRYVVQAYKDLIQGSITCSPTAKKSSGHILAITVKFMEKDNWALTFRKVFNLLVERKKVSDILSASALVDVSDFRLLFFSY